MIRRNPTPAPSSRPAFSVQAWLDSLVGEAAPTPKATGSPAAGEHQVLRPYQADALEHAKQWLSQATVGDRILYACPTGTGKGTLELALQRAIPNSIILTPSLEVVRGFLQRSGLYHSSMSDDALAKAAWTIGTSTPKRYANRLLSGDYTSPDVVIWDEAHHAVGSNSTSGDLWGIVPHAKYIGFTATAFRGTPKGSVELRSDWGKPHTLLTIPQAAQLGYYAVPTFEVVPLMDDDRIMVKGGKFVNKPTTTMFSSRVEALADLVAKLGTHTPTVVTTPNTACAGRLVEELDALSVQAHMVVAHTKGPARAKAYESCRKGESILVVVNVLNEGWDGPWLGRYIDAAPTLSPVCWLQRLGRMTRPKSYRPQYICTNRNLERHAYLMHGAVPRQVIAQAQEAFEKPSKRLGSRSIGLEALSKFKPIQLPLDHGVTGTMYTLYEVTEDATTIEYAVLSDPCTPTPLCAERRIGRKDDGTLDYDAKDCKWRATTLRDDLQGFATSRRRSKATKGQKAWWTRRARARGLDPSAVDGISQRQFAALPILEQLNRSMLR